MVNFDFELNESLKTKKRGNYIYFLFALFGTII